MNHTGQAPTILPDPKDAIIAQLRADLDKALGDAEVWRSAHDQQRGRAEKAEALQSETTRHCSICGAERTKSNLGLGPCQNGHTLMEEAYATHPDGEPSEAIPDSARGGPKGVAPSIDKRENTPRADAIAKMHNGMEQHRAVQQLERELAEAQAIATRQMNDAEAARLEIAELKTLSSATREVYPTVLYDKVLQECSCGFPNRGPCNRSQTDCVMYKRSRYVGGKP